MLVLLLQIQNSIYFCRQVGNEMVLGKSKIQANRICKVSLSKCYLGRDDWAALGQGEHLRALL